MEQRNDNSSLFLQVNKASFIMPVWNTLFQSQIMKPGTSSFKRVRGPQCHQWRRHYQGQNYDCIIMNIHVFKWMVLMVFSCRRGNSLLASWVIREGWCVFQIEPGFRWQITCKKAHCQKFIGQSCSDWDMENNSIYFLNPPSIIPEIHLPSKSKRPDGPGGFRCR